MWYFPFYLFLIFFFFFFNDTATTEIYTLSLHDAHPVPCQLRLECRLVELRIAEGGESRSPALHGRDKALLAYDSIRHVAEPCLPEEVQALLRLAPRHVERIVPQEENADGSEHTVAS